METIVSGETTVNMIKMMASILIVIEVSNCPLSSHSSNYTHSVMILNGQWIIWARSAINTRTKEWKMARENHTDDLVFWASFTKQANLTERERKKKQTKCKNTWQAQNLLTVNHTHSHTHTPGNKSTGKWNVFVWCFFFIQIRQFFRSAKNIWCLRESEAQWDVSPFVFSIFICYSQVKYGALQYVYLIQITRCCYSHILVDIISTTVYSFVCLFTFCASGEGDEER